MTITAGQRTRIRRLFYAEHWKVGTIFLYWRGRVDFLVEALIGPRP